MKRVTILASILNVVSAGPKHHVESFVSIARPKTNNVAVGAPQYSCSAGFELVGKKCERRITEPPEISCPPGFYQNGNICQNDVPMSERCPQGTTPSGKTCSVHETSPAIASCPLSYTDNGVACEQTIQLPIVQVCEQGTQQKGQCVGSAVSSFAVEKFCPPGYTENGKGCVRSTTYNCSPTSAKGYEPGRHLGHRKNVYDDFYGSKSSVPVSKPPVISIVSKECERKEFAPYTTRKFCPQGFAAQGKECVSSITYPLVNRCSTGGSVESCFKMENVPYEYSCPPEGAVVGTDCITHRETRMEQVCPDGWTQSSKEGCVKTEAVQQACPHGLSFGGDGYCTGVEIKEPEVTIQMSCVGKNCFGQ